MNCTECRAFACQNRLDGKGRIVYVNHPLLGLVILGSSFAIIDDCVVKQAIQEEEIPNVTDYLERNDRVIKSL